MKKSNWTWWIILLLVGCVDPYRPPMEATSQGSYLVVEGFLNMGGLTKIQLSRTQSLSDTKEAKKETKAKVFIEDEQSSKQILLENSAGIYSGKLTVDSTRKYRLNISTTLNKQYISDFVVVKQTPSFEIIREIKDEVKDDGVHIYVNTADETKSATYYMWQYEETWEYYAPGLSPGPNPLAFSHCWKTTSSPDINIISTSRLEKNIVKRYPLLFIPHESDKFVHKWSVLVKQYGLTREAFDYWFEMKNNTENMGTLFDPLPTRLRGNIKCATDPEEPVIGYFGACEIREQRMFIDIFDLLAFDLLWSLKVYNPLACCVYQGPCQTKACTDCRALGGVVNRPDFWE